MKSPTLFIQSSLLFLLILTIPRVHSGEHEELSNLRNGYESAVERAVLPLEARYLDHLRKLQNKYTRQSNLDAAIQVREEIKIVEGKIAARKSEGRGKSESKPTETDSFSEFLQKSELSWDGRNGKITIQFNKEKAVVKANGIEIMEKDYKIVPPLMVEFEWSPGDLHTFTLDKNKRNFSRKAQSSGDLLTGVISRKSQL